MVLWICQVSEQLDVKGRQKETLCNIRQKQGLRISVIAIHTLMKIEKTDALTLFFLHFTLFIHLYK